MPVSAFTGLLLLAVAFRQQLAEYEEKQEAFQLSAFYFLLFRVLPATIYNLPVSAFF